MTDARTPIAKPVVDAAGQPEREPQACSRCGLADQVADRCAGCGSFLPSNLAQWRHGLRSFQVAGRLDETLRQSVEDWRSEIVSAQGGLKELEREPLRAGLIRSLVNSEVVERLAVQALAKAGISSSEGKKLAAVAASASDRKLRLTQALGMDRRARQVQTLAEVLRDDA